MSELKTALKEAKQLLSTDKSQEAIDLLQPLIDKDVKDYMLFCFGALANANLEEYEEAQELYEDAIKLDNTKPQAWLGLFKLYDAEDINLSKRGLDVCAKVLEIGDEDKKRAATDLQRRIFLKLNDYDRLLGDLGEDEELMQEIIDKLEPKKYPSAIERKTLSAAFEQLSPHLKEYPDYWLKYCKFLFETDKPIRKEILNYVSNGHNCDEWISARLLELLAEDYFVESNVIDSPVWRFLNKDLFDKEEDFVFTLLDNLKEDNLTSALEILDRLSYSQITSYPACLVSSRLLVEIENWEQVVKVLNAFSKKVITNAEVISTRNWLLVKGYLERDGAVPDNMLVDKCCSASSVPKEFYEERIQLEVLAKSTNNAWKDDLDDFNRRRVSFLEAFLSRNYEEALLKGSDLIESDRASWKDMLYFAESRLSCEQDSVPLLVKIAKMAPRSSRVFFLLGVALQKKNLAKAKSCLERAVKIQPKNLEYVKTLDQVLADMNADAQTRLSYLKPLFTKEKHKWLRETVAKLSLAVGDLDTAISEYQWMLRNSPKEVTIWAKLAEAYSKNGHLASAMNAYEQILELQPDSNHCISLICLLIRMKKDDEALKKITTWRSNGHENSDATAVVDILETLAHLRLALTKYGEEKMNHIREAVQLITPIIDKQIEYALPYKLAGDILVHISRFNKKYLDSFELNPKWNITYTNLFSKATDYYLRALQFGKDNILAWSDLAVSLLLNSRQTNSCEDAENAAEILEKAILRANTSAIKSDLWSLLGEARRLSKQSPASQQHCYIRALELNKANNEAWLRLALLYFENGKKQEAHQAFETSLKYNPLSSEAWCGWAIKADEEGVKSEAMAMYRQSITIKALPDAIIRFTSFICEDIRAFNTSFDTSSVMKDFSEIFDIYYSSYTNENKSLLMYLGVLAELFGHYSEAVSCYRNASVSESDKNLQRALLKQGQHPSAETVLNPKWVKLVDNSSDELFKIVKEDPVYKDVFNALEKEDENSDDLRELLLKHRKYVSMPLVISAIILFNIKISDTAVQALHEVLPRHELIDVFPTVLPEGLDTELRYLEQDGEEPFRYKNHIAKELYEELKKKREALENSTA